MKKTSILATIGLVMAGCASPMVAKYVAGSEIYRQNVPVQSVHLYYDKNDIPFKYKEIGRVFVNHINYWHDDPAGQIDAIKIEAAKYGADAVIIVKEVKQKSFYSATGSIAEGSSADVFHYHGIAIAKDLS